MRKIDSQQTFFAVLRAGLWEQRVRLSASDRIDFSALYQLAEEQSVVGLCAAGFDHIEGRVIPEQFLATFKESIQSLETRNMAMNYFIGVMVDRMRDAGINTLLVKGQGVAQCYERPLWRSAGDVDFFLDAENYEKAKVFLMPLAVSVDPEEKQSMHQGMTIDPWVVELHGKLPTELSARINSVVEEVQSDIFQNGGVRVWRNDNVDVYLPSADNDAIIIFTHFLQHFFVGGVGLRQVSDWCRLLWTYREEIDRDLLRGRLETMGVMSEWKAFASFAVSWLGMPEEAMPFYDEAPRYLRKAGRICKHILKTGNFGHNQDQSYRSKYPKVVQNVITFFRRFGEFFYLSLVFPVDGPRFFANYVTGKFR